MYALALFNQIQEFLSITVFKTRQITAHILGPELHNYYILTNGDVVPTNVSGLERYLPTAHLYIVETRRITHALAPLEGRYRPLPILGLSIEIPEREPIDISDWVGSIRMNPIIDITPRQLVTLWAKTHNTYVPNTMLEVTDAMGNVHKVI